ncbi:MAG: phosphohydrolase [Pseudomonadales bacterium]
MMTVEEYFESGKPVPTTARFTSLQNSTVEDWAAVAAHGDMRDGGIADTLLEMLYKQNDDPGVYPVNRYEHGLQTATLAWLDGERDEEMLALALLHDVGDVLGLGNHAEVLAAIIKPYVSPENYWLIKHHEIFQAKSYSSFFGEDPDIYKRYRGHPCFKRTAYFCAKWDNPAFDKNFESMNIEHFLPMVYKVFSEPKRDVWTSVDDD